MEPDVDCHRADLVGLEIGFVFGGMLVMGAPGLVEEIPENEATREEGRSCALQ
jgi:hypothetical protein